MRYEEAVLSCCMQSESSYRSAVAVLGSGSFEEPWQSVLFDEIGKYYSSRNHKIKHCLSDLIVFLYERNKVDPALIDEVGHLASPILNDDEYIRYVLLKSQRRDARAILGDLREMADDPSTTISDLYSVASSAFLGLLRSGPSAPNPSLIDTLDEHQRDAQLAEESGDSVYVQTGFKELDGFLQPGLTRCELHVVAATPGTGKTAFAMNIGWYVASVLKQPVHFFSIEMTPKELNLRLLALVSETPELRKSNAVSLKRRIDAHRTILENEGSNWHVYDGAHDTVSSMRRKLSEMHHPDTDPPGLIIIDYLGQMRCEDRQLSSTNDRIASILKDLRRLAADFGAPILLLSQMNRQRMNAGRGKFNLSDLRDSGNIEQDSYTVMFLDRPEEAPTKIRVHLEKNRGGDNPRVLDLYSQLSIFKISDTQTHEVKV